MAIFTSNLRIGGKSLFAALYRRHDASSQTKYHELKQLARSQRRVLAGTPGTLKQRTQSGNKYWVREFIRLDGKKSDEYFGPAKSTSADDVERLAQEVALAKALAAGSSHLRLLAYQRIDRKPAAVLAACYNRALFRAGLVLVGSHAYGALLNELGILAAGYKTQDIDLARGQRLEVTVPPGASLETILADTGLRFVPVPGMPSQKPSGSFKLPGAEALALDLLAAGARTGDIVEVKELGAHAQTIAHLDFLVDGSIEAVCLSPNQVVPVFVPAPERFAVHKLFSSQSRGAADRGKSGKDLAQAAVLAAALEEETPGKLGEAFRALRASGKAAAKRGAAAASKLLDAHPDAKRALERLARR